MEVADPPTFARLASAFRLLDVDCVTMVVIGEPLLILMSSALSVLPMTFPAPSTTCVFCEPFVWASEIAAPVGRGNDAMETGWVLRLPSTTGLEASVARRAMVAVPLVHEPLRIRA